MALIVQKDHPSSEKSDETDSERDAEITAFKHNTLQVMKIMHYFVETVIKPFHFFVFLALSYHIGWSISLEHAYSSA